MSIVRCGRMAYPDYGNLTFTTMSLSAMTIDATGEKAAWVGSVWNADRTTKSIRKVGIRFGTVTKAGGSALTLSLQNVSTTTGQIQPDGTQDQTVALSNASLATGWYLTGNLSSDRSVAFGELLAVVVEFDGSGRLSTDTFGLNNATTSIGDHRVNTTALAGSWSVNVQNPLIMFEFSDGTVGGFVHGFPISNATTYSIHINSATQDEVGLEFQMPFDCEIDGAILSLQVGNSSSNFDLVLYDSANTVIVTQSHDANAIQVAGTPYQFIVAWPPVNIAANSTYRLTVKPTTVNTTTIFAQVVAAAGNLAAMPGGTAFKLCKRIDAGAWTTVSTEVPLASLMISGVDITQATGNTSLSRVHLGM